MCPRPLLTLLVVVLSMSSTLLGPGPATAVSSESEEAGGAGASASVGFRGWTSYVRTSPVTATIDADVLYDDAGAEVVSIDIRTSRTSMTSTAQTAWVEPTNLQGLLVVEGDRRGPVKVRKDVPLRVAQGQVLCVSARATDSFGVTSPWSDRSCVLRFLDDRRLERHGPLRTVRDERYTNGTATHIDPGGSLVLRGVPRGAAVIVAWERRRLDRPPTSNIRVLPPGAQARHAVCGAGEAGAFNRTLYWDYCPRRTDARGPVRLHADREYPTYAVQGVLILPPWAR